MAKATKVKPKSRGGLGWLEGFNEWMVRCGLESNGHPGTDKFINNVGDEATMELTLHGKIQNTPASEVEVVVDREAPRVVHHWLCPRIGEGVRREDQGRDEGHDVGVQGCFLVAGGFGAGEQGHGGSFRDQGRGGAQRLRFSTS